MAIFDPTGHKVMTVKKGGTTKVWLFSDALKNSSYSAQGRKHEVWFGKTIEALALTASKFEEMKGKGKDYKPTKYELGSLSLDYSKSIEEMKHECESCIHLLKDKYQSERRKVTQHQTSSLEELYQECGAIFKPLPGFSVIQQQIKDKVTFYAIVNCKIKF